MGTRTRWIWVVVEHAALAAFVAMLVLVVAQVFFRYILEISVPWTEEAARWFYAYQIFLGCTIAARDRLHLRATFLLERFPPRLAAAVECLIAAGTLLFVAGIVWGGVVMVWATSTVEAGSFALSMSYLYLAIPVSFGIVFALAARDLGRAWRPLRRNPKP
jgi:TRAP-type C4-dicarboxylate transport system permease small subunit